MSAGSRRSIDIEGFSHANPIPAASRLGPLLMSSIIGPRAADGTVPDDPTAQVRVLFGHVGAMLEAAGAGWEHVVKVTFFAPSLDTRAVINEVWVEHFPDPASRPARHTQVSTGAHIQCDFTAYVAD